MRRIRTYTCRYCHSEENVQIRVGIGRICDTCYAPTIDKKIVNGKKSCLDCGVFGSEKADLIKPCVKGHGGRFL